MPTPCFCNALPPTEHFPNMRLPQAALTLSLLLCLSIPAPARAETVLFACSDLCPIPLFEALELELRGHGAFLVARLSPAGFTVAAHESDARRMASLTPAAAVLWVEREPPLRVRVLSPREAAVREAPLAAPPETIDPRLFAAIAGDVVLRALGTPGHAEVLPTSGPVAAWAPEAPAPALTPPPSAPSSPRGARFRRFFLRAGAVLGFALVKRGLKTDRAPPKQYVQNAIQVQTATNSQEAGREALRKDGYECDWEQNPALAGGMIASNCTVTVEEAGFVLSPGFELQAGAYLNERVTLATFLRVTPTAGFGRLNHTLFGVQAEYALTERSERGFWVHAGGGLGFGRVQVKPSERARGPYITSGPGTAHLTLPLGYRFVPGFGLYVTLSVRVLFPDVLWVVDPTLGVEGRL